MARMAYPSDLTDVQWRLISRRIPRAKPGGRPRSVDMREVSLRKETTYTVFIVDELCSSIHRGSCRA